MPIRAKLHNFQMQIGSYPNRDAAQIRTRRDPYCSDLARLFSPHPK